MQSPSSDDGIHGGHRNHQSLRAGECILNVLNINKITQFYFIPFIIIDTIIIMGSIGAAASMHITCARCDSPNHPIAPIAPLGLPKGEETAGLSKEPWFDRI